jgi:hypothetical protein
MSTKGSFPVGKVARAWSDHSPPSSAKVKNAWSQTFTPQHTFMVWCLLKHRDNFTLTWKFNSGLYQSNINTTLHETLNFIDFLRNDHTKILYMGGGNPDLNKVYNLYLKHFLTPECLTKYKENNSMYSE